MTQENNNFDPENVPPIICSCFIDGKMIGHCDNPNSLLEIFDSFLKKNFEDTKKDFKKKSIMLYFSVVNYNEIDVAMFTESDFENREEVYDLYDLVIEQFVECLNNEFPSEFNSNNYDFSESEDE